MEFVCYNPYIYVENLGGGYNMKREIHAEPPEEQKPCSLGLAIARAVRVSCDEQDALQRICMLLNIWGVRIAPGELGSERLED